MLWRGGCYTVFRGSSDLSGLSFLVCEVGMASPSLGWRGSRSEVMSAGPGTQGKPGRQSPAQAGALGWGALTLGEAVPGVDVAVIHVHDVHALVAHEVALVPVALVGTQKALRAGHPGPNQDPPARPRERPLGGGWWWRGSRGPAWGSGVFLGVGNPTAWGRVSEAAWGEGDPSPAGRSPDGRRGPRWWLWRCPPLGQTGTAQGKRGER